jgi:hypothetical protein
MISYPKDEIQSQSEFLSGELNQQEIKKTSGWAKRDRLSTLDSFLGRPISKFGLSTSLSRIKAH